MAFDQKLWDANACACRCLIELARIKQGNVISDLDFYNRFSSKLSAGWIGGTNSYMQGLFAVELGLAHELDTFTDPLRILKEWGKKECSGILLHTERMPDKGDPTTLVDVSHAMLAVKITGNGFRAWNPTKDGKAAEQDFPWFYWYQWMMRATVLYLH